MQEFPRSRKIYCISYGILPDGLFLFGFDSCIQGLAGGSVPGAIGQTKQIDNNKINHVKKRETKLYNQTLSKDKTFTTFKNKSH